ncbi:MULTISPECIES: glycosyltransferase family 4 protein [Capnocytophaga]|uniref:Glycosyltransferase family 4 protein n=1 Tax=Capnocytophaga canis TaxID=1848903 RepID=A0A3A1YIS3_9FLAO|nr:MULTISPECIES: glycosyltransferase family 4 protein [Capnocytophaga]ATA74634.1 hypothetical protein CGC52_03795 [Capnocytophaga sp. H2931]RIY35917.1 hypothetical protein CKY20_08625 [Capnocytophaga canis]
MKEKIRICLVTSLFTGKGGTERALINLANNLSRHYGVVDVISLFTNSEAIPQYHIFPEVNVKHLNLKERNLLHRTWKMFKTLRIHIKNYDFAIGQVPFINLSLGFYKFLNLNKKTKVLAIEHTSYFAVGKTSRYLSFWLYRYLDKVICLTKKNEKEFNKKGIIKTCVIPNAVPMEYEKKTQGAVRENIILSVGRLSHEKNFVYLINTLQNVLKNNPSWKLVIVGDKGNDSDNIYQTIHKLELNEQVLISPFTTDIISKYLSASIYVLVSKYEGFPMVLVEAKYFGLPIVAHNCNTGPSEIINNEIDGLLTPYMDSEAFALAVEYLILNQDIRYKMSQQTLQSIKEFSSREILSKWQNIFNNLK